MRMDASKRRERYRHMQDAELYERSNRSPLAREEISRRTEGRRLKKKMIAYFATSMNIGGGVGRLM